MFGEVAYDDSAERHGPYSHPAVNYLQGFCYWMIGLEIQQSNLLPPTSESPSDIQLVFGVVSQVRKSRDFSPPPQIYATKCLLSEVTTQRQEIIRWQP